MSWELRRGQWYYYTVARVNGKPRRVYRGSGVLAQHHELLDREAARRRGKRRTAAAVRRQLLTALAQAGRAVLNWARQAVRAARLINGEHQHKGQWRQRRSPKTIRHQREEATMNSTTEARVSDGVSLEEYVRRLND